jgi:hypothetical protein
MNRWLSEDLEQGTKAGRGKKEGLQRRIWGGSGHLCYFDGGVGFLSRYLCLTIHFNMQFIVRQFYLNKTETDRKENSERGP